MRKQLKHMVIKALRYSGVPFLFREIIQRNKVTILCLHDMHPDIAERAFDYLSRHYNIISLNDFLKARLAADSAALPPKALVITFDDGHLGNYDLLPLLEARKIPVTIFLCAGIVDTNRHYWFNFKHPDIDKEALKRVPNRERLRRLAKAGFFPEQEFSRPEAMNRRQIEAMKPVVNFQGHTVLHPCLPQCTDAEARQEIEAGRQLLEENFGLSVNAIAYPNGDYSDRDVQLVRAAGYQLGLTVDFGFNTLKTDPFKLKRLSIGDTDNPDTIALKASGAWAFFKTRNGARQGYGWQRANTLEN
ncbi:MAG: polysaccharide deacetylase family protein [Lewinellaceae bacterium]|nr:polysaccharide deacetylase family protein [Saprospiraceae bacterium]MCB9330178.1 polysaccharide deacetylase family protein [Lewinellaceae bacterium]